MPVGRDGRFVINGAATGVNQNRNELKNDASVPTKSVIDEKCQVSGSDPYSFYSLIGISNCRWQTRRGVALALDVEDRKAALTCDASK